MKFFIGESPGKMKKIQGFSGLLFLLWSFSALAAGPGAEDNKRHFQAAASEVNVPAELTQAIARVESGGSPYALNVEGKGYVFASREEALAAAKQAEAAGQSFDSGIMQINNWWLKRYGIPLEAAFEPEANILLGSWILRQELNRAGDVWTAVARYHSPHAGRGERYADLVRQALERGPLQKKENPAAAKQQRETRTAKTTQAVVVHRAAPPTPSESRASLVAYRRSTRAALEPDAAAFEGQPFVKRGRSRTPVNEDF